MQPVVSVIVPAYNAEKYLGVCLDSLIGQSYKNIEILVVNDGSTDHTKFILDNYEKKDPRIRAIHTENHGVSAARNTALDKATGSYVYFCDADDWLQESAIETAVSCMHTYDVDLVVVNIYAHFPEQKPVLRTNYLPSGRYNKIALLKYAVGIFGKDNRVTTCFLCINNKLFRRDSFFEKDGSSIRFCEGMKYLEDGLFLVEVLKNVRTFFFESKGLYNRRMHEESAMHSLDISELAFKMYSGYEAIIQSATIRENPIAMCYARNAFLRTVRFYARKSIEGNRPEAIVRMRDRFQGDPEVLRVLAQFSEEGMG